MTDELHMNTAAADVLAVQLEAVTRLQQQVDGLDKEVSVAAGLIETLAKRNRTLVRENLRLSLALEERGRRRAELS